MYDETSIIQHHGFKSDLVANTDVYAVCNGDRNNLVIIGSENKQKKPDVNGTSLYFNKNNYFNLQQGKLKIQTEGIEPLVEIRKRA